MPKQQLRQRILLQRQALPPEEIQKRSEILCDMMLSSSQYQSAKALYGYLPFRNEVQILPLLHQAMADGKLVALPKCCGKEMRFIQVDDLTRMQFGRFGAPEPVQNAPIAREDSALVIVPGVVFDRRGYRIGYGGGYYDRFLAQEPNHPTIALCYDFQLVPRLDADPHDIPVDTIFSR